MTRFTLFPSSRNLSTRTAVRGVSKYIKVKLTEEQYKVARCRIMQMAEAERASVSILS